MKKLYLVDISSFFFRSYYAVPPHMTSPKGLPTNALYGTLSMLLKLRDKKKPDYLASCFDSKEPSFRSELFPSYKADREEMPEDLKRQVPFLKNMIKLLGIYSIERAGFEADDLIGTMTAFGRAKDLSVVIVSGDKDFAQLVSKDTVLFDTMKSKIYSPEGVKEKWGVLPHQMIDYLALAGDSSDSIPGVRGIGPKGAVRLLEEYSDLENIYKNLSHVKGALRQKLESGKELCFLSQKLVTIRQDVPISCELKNLEWPFAKSPELKAFLKELGFASFLKNLYREEIKNKASVPQETKPATLGASAEKKALSEEKASSIQSEKPSKRKSSALKQKTLMDLKNKGPETEDSKKLIFSAEPVKQSPLDFFTSLKPYSSLYVWLLEDKLCVAYESTVKVFESPLPEGTGELLDNKWIRYSGYDLKACWKHLGCKKPIPEWDLMIASHLLDSDSPISFEHVVTKHLKQSPSEDPKEAYQAHKVLRKTLEEEMKSKGLWELFKSIEIPLAAVLYNMEEKGVLIDKAEVKRQSHSLEKDLKLLEEGIHELASESFNINSPKQLADVLFEKLGLPKGRKTKSGFSTDSYTLMKIKDLHPILPLLLDYRELFKLKATYIEALVALVSFKTGRIHTHFQQTATSTGRLSSIHPNLQNIPIRTPRGRQIRKCFISPKDELLVSADYSQIELRLLAHITEDPGLCRAFKEDLDVHAVTASEIFHVPLKEVTSDLRAKAKAVNFGIAYGQGAFGLAEFLSIPRQTAREIIDNYFNKFKKVRDYIESTKQEAARKGYVTTLFGRKRFFKSSDFRHPRLRALSERAAVNAPIQGSASDLVKKAMIEAHESLPLALLLQVHDELLFECPEGEFLHEEKCIRSLMENVSPLKVPLKMNIASGKNWKEAHS